MRYLIALIFSCCLAFFAFSDVPRLINYQGKLTDAQGNARSGTVLLSFEIYNAATEGELLWGPQTFENVPLLDGHFNVILGEFDENQVSIMEAIRQGDVYLQIAENNTAIGPRQNMLSAPYSVASAYSEQFAGITADDFPSTMSVQWQTKKLAADILNSDLQGGSVFPEELEFKNLEAGKTYMVSLRIFAASERAIGASTTLGCEFGNFEAVSVGARSSDTSGTIESITAGASDIFLATENENMSLRCYVRAVRDSGDARVIAGATRVTLYELPFGLQTTKWD